MDIKGRDEIALLVKFWNQTEGRDKLAKCMQYGSRGLAWALQGNKEAAAQFSALFKTTSDSRKIFRLGKSLNEYTKLKDILANSKDADPLLKLFNFASRFAFLVYWLYDNLTILSKIKFIKGDTAKNQKKSALFWSIGLLFGVLLELYKLQKSVEQENLAIKAASSANGNVASPPHEIMKKIKADRNLIYINLAKNLGDLIPATNGIELPHRLLGHGFNEGLIAFGGFLSAALTCFQLYPAK